MYRDGYSLAGQYTVEEDLSSIYSVIRTAKSLATGEELNFIATLTV